MAARHFASHALIGSTGRRHGTRYIFKLEDIRDAMDQPYFRFRNSDCEAKWWKYMTSEPKNASTT